MKYANRKEAGEVLAEALHQYANRDDAYVLGLPRGGVPVAFAIARALHLPLDVFVVRKLGTPGQKELAMGALATGGAVIFNQSIIHEMRISEDEIKAVMAAEEQELRRREQNYRGKRAFPNLQDKTVILVDDGIATGATIKAAIKALRLYQPAKIIVAVPVAAKDTCEEIKLLVDQLICPMQPTYFDAVGAWYEDFSQTEDAEVSELLQKGRELSHHH